MNKESLTVSQCLNKKDWICLLKCDNISVQNIYHIYIYVCIYEYICMYIYIYLYVIYFQNYKYNDFYYKVFEYLHNNISLTPLWQVCG